MSSAKFWSVTPKLKSMVRCALRNPKACQIKSHNRQRLTDRLFVPVRIANLIDLIAVVFTLQVSEP